MKSQESCKAEDFPDVYIKLWVWFDVNGVHVRSEQRELIWGGDDVPPYATLIDVEWDWKYNQVKSVTLEDIPKSARDPSLDETFWKTYWDKTCGCNQHNENYCCGAH